MSRGIFILLVLLLVQVALGFSLERKAWLMTDDEAVHRLFAVEPSVIDDILITDDQGNETVLLRVGQTWTLPELEDLPADPERIQGVLEAITRGETGWHVADTVAARQRFQVAAYHFRRRVIMVGDGELLGTVYLGTSPGFRRVHARNDTGNEIYALRLNAFDVPASSEPWLDRRLLQIRAPLQIVADGYTLQRADDRWLSDGGLEPDAREVAALLQALRTLQVQGLADEDMQRDLASLQPELVLDVTGLSGSSRLEFFSSSGSYYVYSGEFALFFELSGFEYDRLTSMDARLLQGAMP